MIKDGVVLLPCYNPDEQIMSAFLESLSKAFKHIVLINDGCSEIHKDFFKKLEKKYPVVTHYRNFGKGRGIKNGLNYILNNYPDCKVIISADCDGQHSVEDIKKCYQAALENQDAYILGYRDFDSKNVPFKSRYGNKITRGVLKVFVGLNVRDTQTGLRAMSRTVASQMLTVNGERYEYETNTLLFCKNEDIPLVEVPIETIYIEDNRTSHFNPIKDSILIYKLFVKYIVCALSSFVVDLLLFTCFLNILNHFSMGKSIFIATIIARILSSLYNYFVNAKLVFKKMNKTSLIKYAILVVVQMFASAFAVSLLHKWVSIAPVILKMGVDFIIFIINFIIQREFIFKR